MSGYLDVNYIYIYIFCKKRLAIMLVFVSQTTFIYLFLWNYSLRIKVRIPQCNEFSKNIRLFGFPQRKYCSFWPFSFQLKRRWYSSSLVDKIIFVIFVSQPHIAKYVFQKLFLKQQKGENSFYHTTNQKFCSCNVATCISQILYVLVKIYMIGANKVR